MFTAPAHSHLACLELMETALKMSVALRVPAGKRWHTHTGQPKELNKGTACIGLGRVQGGGRDGRQSQPGAPGPTGPGEGLGPGTQREQRLGEGPHRRGGLPGPTASVHTGQPPGTAAGRDMQGRCEMPCTGPHNWRPV